MRKSTIFATIGVVILVGGAAAVRYVALPAVHQVPSNVDTTVNLSGTMDLFDQAALLSGNAAGIIKPNVPVTVAQHVKVVSTAGSTAVMSDETTVTGPGSTTIMSSKNTWAVDRITLLGATAPAGTTVTPHDGLVVGFPLTPEPKDYPYWDTTTQSTATAQYLRAEDHAGRASYVYQVKASGAVKDPQILAVVPKGLPKEALLAFAAGLDPQVQQMLAGLAPLLPAEIPLNYVATTDTTFWVDTSTGIVLDVNRSQKIGADLPAQFAQLGLPTEINLKLAYTADTVSKAAADAATATDQLRLISTVIPLALLGLGLIVLLVTLIAAIRRRGKTPSAPGPADAPPPAVEAGTPTAS
jgi:Porin PorA